MKVVLILMLIITMMFVESPSKFELTHIPSRGLEEEIQKVVNG